MRKTILHHIAVISLLILFSCEEEQLSSSNLQELKVYGFVVQSASGNGNNGFILNCEDRIVHLSNEGYVSWQIGLEELYDTLPNDNFRIAQTITSKVTGDIYLFGSLVNLDQKIVDLLIYKLDGSGSVSWVKRTPIYQDYSYTGGPRANEEFYMHENNYPISDLKEESIVVAFCYDVKNGVRPYYKLLSFDLEGVLDDSASYQMDDFYGRVYKVLIASNSQILLSRGERNRFYIESFDAGLDRKHSHRISEFTDFNGVDFSDFGDPILNNIMEISPGKIALTGHLDVGNNVNTNFITNFEFLTVNIENADTTYRISGLNEYKELSHYSFLAKDFDIRMIGVRHGLNELIQDVDSDLMLLDVSPTGDVLNTQSLIVNQGLEGVFASENSDGTLTLIGTKTGFTNNRKETFFLKVKPSDANVTP